jgi:hypothetical protein
LLRAIGALRIDDEDLVGPRDRVKATRQVRRFVLDRDKD